MAITPAYFFFEKNGRKHPKSRNGQVRSLPRFNFFGGRGSDLEVPSTMAISSGVYPDLSKGQRASPEPCRRIEVKDEVLDFTLT